MTQEYICYCFKHTREVLEEDARKHGRSTIMAQIIVSSKMKRMKNHEKGSSLPLTFEKFSPFLFQMLFFSCHDS